jgi:mannose-6-phosphate isomerase-like protein (cupin superfamily)
MPSDNRPYLLGRAEGQAVWFLGNLVTVKAAGAQTRGRLTVAEFLNPAGFAPPLHRHLAEDEMFYILSGTARFLCDGEQLTARPGDFVLLPVGLPHTFVVDSAEPLRCLQITTPSGFEDFAAAVGAPAPLDPAALGHAAARHHIEILGPPPSTITETGAGTSEGAAQHW